MCDFHSLTFSFLLHSLSGWPNRNQQFSAPCYRLGACYQVWDLCVLHFDYVHIWRHWLVVWGENGPRVPLGFSSVWACEPRTARENIRAINYMWNSQQTSKHCEITQLLHPPLRLYKRHTASPEQRPALLDLQLRTYPQCVDLCRVQCNSHSLSLDFMIRYCEC